MNDQFAIACAGTGFRGAFAHGVLTALESHGHRFAAYAGSSMTALPVAAAAAGEARAIGIDHWVKSLELLRLPRNGMSDLVFAQINALKPMLRKRLFVAGMPRLLIATTGVHTIEGALETQGVRAGALGRRLLVHAGRHDRSWAADHLTPHLWDSAAADDAHRLTADNIEEVLYATTRLLHAWAVSAEVDGIPFIDASYTNACPALELAALDFRDVIAIANEPGPLYRDMFRTSVIPEMSWRARIRIIRPTIDPKRLGVEETIATEAGLIALYDHGVDAGLAFLHEPDDDDESVEDAETPPPDTEPAAQPDTVPSTDD